MNGLVVQKPLNCLESCLKRNVCKLIAVELFQRTVVNSTSPNLEALLI
jgi:hypothetical protein